MKNYDVLVVDSFPCVKCDESKYGKMTITRRDQFILEKLATQAQQCNCALTIVLHSTKAGEYKGSTFFKHTVDNMITLKKIATENDRSSVSVFNILISGS